MRLQQGLKEKGPTREGGAKFSGRMVERKEELDQIHAVLPFPHMEAITTDPPGRMEHLAGSIGGRKLTPAVPSVFRFGIRSFALARSNLLT
jgi:hypothetical protein